MAVAARQFEPSPAPLSAAVLDSRRWLIVGLLFVASMINYLDRATLSVALPLIGHDLSLAPKFEGVLLSAFFWSYAPMQIPIGWAADWLDLRWLYAATFALWSLAQGLTGFAGSLGALIFFRILLGVGESIYLPGGTKIVNRLFSPAERGLPCGVFDFGTRIGFALGTLTIPWLLVRSGWHVTFRLIGFLALLWLIPWLLATRGRLSQSRRSASPPRPALRNRLLPLLRNRDLVGICLGFFCFDYYWYLLVTWLPNYLVAARHFTILGAGLYATLPFLVFGASEPVGGWIVDQLVRRGWDETRTRKGMVTIAFLTGLLLIPASRVQSPMTAVALLVGASLVGLATGNLLVILQCCAPPEDVGLWTGFENFFGNVGGILAPLVTGVLISRTGSYAPGFALAAITLLTGLLSYWFIVGDLRPLSAHAARIDVSVSE